MKGKLSFMWRATLALVLVLSLGVVMAAPVAAADAVVDIAAIPGVTAPVTGGTPVTAITETAQYTGAVTWTPDDTPFAAEQAYTAIIILTAKTGYTLTGVAANFFTVAGATATNPAGSGVVTAVFPATAAVVDIAAIPGVTAPALGGTPVAAITPTAQYTGTVAWDPDEDPFLGEQAYTAEITLTAKAGFTLTGVAENSFTVTGATTVTNPANSGVVTAVFPATAAAVVDIAAIPGVTVPVIGESPVAAITETDQYTGTVAWSPVLDPFAADVYTATITLAAKAGFTLTGVAANFFTVDGATATNSADLGVVTAIFPIAEAAAVVDIAAIPGVTAPAVGGSPVAAITPTAQYTGTVVWSPVEDPFLGEKAYTATITLTAKTGFTLTGVTVDFFTVTGATATNPANSGVVSAVFPATAAAVVIDIAAIPGVTAPVTGGTPVAAIAPTAQYTGTVTWSPVVAATFLGATVYTAEITLTAKAGFTLTGVAADFFTVAGAVATNTVSSGVVTAVFPATDAVVDIAAIPGVTAPVIGGTPVAAITPTAQYTGTVAWSPVVATTFLGGQIYTATITLTAEAGFTLTGVAADSFTVAGATATNSANSGVVSAVFPATDAVVDIAAIPGVTAPEVGEIPVPTITATAQYTGAVTWSPAGTFAGETAYTAIIILTAKAGYTLEGVAANSFTVAGATTTNPANSGVVTAIFPVTYDVIMVLPADTWVLISIPLWISTDSAWIDEPVLVYKAAGSVFSTDVTLAVDLQPVEALYVKMGSEEGSLGIIFSTGVQGVSAKELVAGWNLISSASSDAGNAQDVLSGLRDVALDGTGLTTVVSQGIYNAFSDDFYVDATNWDNLIPFTLEPLDGYWIRMNAAKTFGVVPGLALP